MLWQVLQAAFAVTLAGLVIGCAAVGLVAIYGDIEDRRDDDQSS